MNKQELIKKYKRLEGVWDAPGAETARQIFLQDLKQLDEPQKVAVPQFVADWIEECGTKEKSLLTAILYTPEKVNSWVGDSDNQELFARAWLDGYLTEEETEIWKQVPGYYNEVSNFGNVRSITHKAGNGKTYQGKNLKPVLTNSGYVNINLITGNDKDRIVKRVHRLVAELFIPNPDGKDEVNHIDGNKQNNRADNLEWVTRNENEQHAYDTGLITILKGSERPLAKLTENDVIKIREEYAKGCLQIELASKYGVARQTISSIVNRKAWTHV